jgi:hypothetical protein
MKQFQVCKRLRARYDILTILFLFLSMLFQGIQCADTPVLVLQRKPRRQDVVNFSPSEGKWATRVRCLGVAFAPRSPHSHQSLRMTQLTALSPRKLTILSPIICHPHKSSGHCPAFPASFSLFQPTVCRRKQQRRPRSLENPTVWTLDSGFMHAALVSRILQSAVCSVLVPAPSGLQSAHPIGNHNSRDMEITA